MQIVPIQTESDIVRARQAARKLAKQMGFSVVNRTRIATAVSELARNVLVHGKGGSMRLEVVVNGSRVGVSCSFLDEGPGIEDVPRAMGEGYSSAGTLGQGLPGARRLMDEMKIESCPGKGTMVEVIKWN